VDGGLQLFDGQPLFGHSKTIRGIFFSILATAIVTPLIGLDWATGLLVAGSAMVGDLLSSFLKRRLKLLASSRAVGIDQLPEAIFPLLVCVRLLDITWVDVVVVALAFFVAEILFSRLLYNLHIRDRPY
jgi:CDP-2,3-bis-(O-geranylgeranyl)-sn-glycerol synthase